MGKKKADEMAAQRSLFLERAQKNGFDGKKAEELFDLMAYFAGYGFNKSHSTAYALIAYQTAYLKAHYTAEFMACLISLEAADSSTMANYIQEAKDMGLQLLPPDINRSEIDFSVVDGKLLFGLRGIKHVGMASLENILEERKKKSFKDLLEFCKRIDLRTSNKRVLESLICAGTFDCLPGNRAQKYEELPKILDLAAEKKKLFLTGQMGLFDTETIDIKDHTTSVDFYTYAPRPDWPDKIKLEKEKEVMGIYVSAQPLDEYAKQLKWLSVQTFAQAVEKLTKSSQQEPMVTVCGVLQSSKIIATKKGDKMAFVQLEDSSAKAEVVIFPKLFTQVEAWLTAYRIFVVRGVVDATSSHQCKIKAQQLIPLELLCDQGTGINRIILELPEQFDEQFLQQIKTLLVKGSIPLEFIFTEQNKKLRLTTQELIACDFSMIQALEHHKIQVTLCL
jgi:DNA polymerase-3 subunit alpha